MSLTATLSNHFKYQRDMKLIDLLTDEIHVLLMRSGFTFNKDDHAELINVKTTSGVIASLTFNDTNNTLTRGTGSFITDGFVVGMEITTNSANSANQGPLLISVCVAAVLTVTTTAGGDPSLTAGAESNVTVTGCDEIATAGGYTQDDTVLAGQTLTEDDTTNTSTMLCDDISWTGSGSGFVTAGAIFYDADTSDNTIIGYLDFGGDQTIAAAASFVLTGVGIQTA